MRVRMLPSPGATLFAHAADMRIFRSDYSNPRRCFRVVGITKMTPRAARTFRSSARRAAFTVGGGGRYVRQRYACGGAKPRVIGAEFAYQKAGAAARLR